MACRSFWAFCRGSGSLELKAFGGVWKQMKNYMGDIVELAGDQLLPKITELTKRTVEWMQANENLIKTKVTETKEGDNFNN